MTGGHHNKTRLDNGIRIVTERIPHVRSVSIGAWVMVGSRHENSENNGISHYIEHMLFKGTRNRTAAEIAQSLESVGGHLNAFTGKDLTCYYAHVLDEHCPRAVDVLSDIMANSVFEEEEMAKEKRVIIEELSTIEETPEELIHDLFWGDLFPRHPLGYAIIGRRESIDSIKRADIFEYLKSNYTGERIVICAAGNLEHDSLVDMVREKFGSFNAGEQQLQKSPDGPVSGKHIIENGAIQAHVCLGTHAYDYRNKNKFALFVLNTLFGAGMSSRLFQNIREQHGLAYSIYSFVEFLFDTGIFGIYLGTDKGNVDASLALIDQELTTLKETKVPEDELERTKSQLKGNLMLGLESTSSRMNRLARLEIFLDGYLSLDETIDEINKVTTTDLSNVANELFAADRIQTTILKPGSVVQ